MTAAQGALAIGRTRDPAAAPLLAPHLADPRISVRALSLYGLGVIGLGTEADRITAQSAHDPSGAVRVAALDALGRYESNQHLSGDQERAAVATIADVLASDADTDVRGRAAITLSFFADGAAAKPAGDALVAAMQQPESRVRQRAMWSIFRRFATAVPFGTIESALHDRDETVRIEAVRAYGKLKNPATLEPLRVMLADPSWRVQEQAAESLLVLDGKPANTSWTSIPAGVHVPVPQPDPLRALAPKTGPTPAVAPLLPVTAHDMLSPAKGPHPRLRLVTTKGNVYVTLYPEWAPGTSQNFMALAARGFYDDNRWFRIVPDFVVQTGEKDDKNTPGPGYTIDAEPNPLEQNAFIISMGLDYDDKTNTPKLDSAGSEYYITLSPQYHLDNAFTVFGAVTSGTDVLGRLIESDRVIRVERVDDQNL